MRYAAVLGGQTHVFENVAPCFTSDSARIKKLGDKWVLESSDFESCQIATEVFQIADTKLRLIHRILALYSGLSSPFKVEYIQVLDVAGRPSAVRGIRGIHEINVYSPRGIDELTNPSGTQPLGSAIAEKAANDSAISEALNLHGDKPLGWSQIYDIIEFLGGAGEITRAGLASRGRTRDVRQTANHHRHLGSRKKYPMPAQPPTLNEASAFASDLLKRWLASRL